MKQLTFIAKFYMCSMIALGSITILVYLQIMPPMLSPLLLVISLLAAVSQAFKIEGPPPYTGYNLSWILYGFAFSQLGLSAAMAIAVIAYVAEWLRSRDSWQTQLLNLALFANTVAVVDLARKAFSQIPLTENLLQVVSIILITGLFALFNHLLHFAMAQIDNNQVILRARSFTSLPILLDFGLLCLGAVAAFIWEINPAGVIFVAILAYLLRTTLKVPALQRQAMTDGKVGLFNATYFARQLEEELERAHRFERPLSIIMADLDMMREINNKHGHLAGDKVLKGIAHILQTHTRKYDVAARFGGEEFAILMPETTIEEAYHRVEAIRQEVENNQIKLNTSTQPIIATMSFGITQRQHLEQTAESLLHEADMAVYEAKKNGRNCIALWIDSDTILTPTSEPVPAESGNERQATSKQKEEQPIAPAISPPSKARSPHLVRLYVGLTFLTALGLILLFPSPQLQSDIEGMLIFTAIVLLAESSSLNIYARETTVSTSVAPLLAGTLLFGPSAAVLQSLIIAIVSLTKKRSPVDRFIFNTSNHIIGALLVAWLLHAIGQSVTTMSLPMQLGISLVAVTLIYSSTTLLLSGIIAISSQNTLYQVWSERFRWLLVYYFALGVVGFVMIFTYLTAGFIGIAVFFVPLLMMRYSQKQYIDHTNASVAELRDKNKALQQQADEINLLNEELLLALAHATDLRDPFVVEHAVNVGRYAVLIAEKMGLPPDRVELIHKAGLLHDIGKLGVPESILFKPASLTADEYALIQAHVTMGADLLAEFHSLEELAPFVRYHHERYDGQGYPSRLRGEEIPLEARIIGLADAIEAMASDRPYRKGSSARYILHEINRQAGTQFDPDVVAAFDQVVQEQGEAVIVNSARFVERPVWDSVLKKPQTKAAEGIATAA